MKQITDTEVFAVLPENAGLVVSTTVCVTGEILVECHDGTMFLAPHQSKGKPRQVFLAGSGRA